MAMFKGFKPQAMNKIAGAMGYQGDMNQFQQYVDQDPARQQQMSMYTNAARKMAAGGYARRFQEGGFNPATRYMMPTQTNEDDPKFITIGSPQDTAANRQLASNKGSEEVSLAFRNTSPYQSPAPAQPLADPRLPTQTTQTSAAGNALGSSVGTLGQAPAQQPAGPIASAGTLPNIPASEIPEVRIPEIGPPFVPDPLLPEQPDPQPQPPSNRGIVTNPAGTQAGTPAYTGASDNTVYDAFAPFRQNVEIYPETGAFKNPNLQSSHDTMLEVLAKEEEADNPLAPVKQEKTNAIVDYLRNIYTGPIYSRETGNTGLGGNQFTEDFAQFANAMGIEIDNTLAQTDGPPLLKIPEGNPTLTQTGWMPQAPAQQPSIGQFTTEQMYQPGVPIGGTTIAAGIQQDPSQMVAPGTGLLTGSVNVPTATASTYQAEQITPSQANLMNAVQAAPAVDSAMQAVQAAQTNPDDPRSKITAAQQTTSSVGDLTAAQGNASLIDNPVQRNIQNGELISGVANGATAAQFTEQIQAATATPSQKATVAGQLDGLMQQFEGGATPAWAAGAMRKATATMAARGLGASSLAGQAIVQAAMESALPIAQADAAVQAQFEGQNLSNRQQRAMLAAQQRATFMGMEFDQAFQSRVQNSARIGDIANMNFTAEQQVQLENSRATNTMNLNNLSNSQAMVMAEASALAQLDTQNLNNRQQSAVQNAQNFLQMDMANLSNQQQTELFKAQQRTQSLFTDQAATNAAAQFNASSENQTDQFFQNLGAQVSQFNATQANAQSQYNAGQANTVNRFNAELNNQRDQFNAQNQLVIAQSNAQWRRQIATADTASINRANELNANAILDISKTAYDNLWNYYGDTMEWAWKSANNELDRMNNLAIAELGADATVAAQKSASSSAAGSALGGLLGTLGSAYIMARVF